MRFSQVAETFDQLEGTSSRHRMVAVLAGLFGAADASDVAQIIYLAQGRLRPPYEAVEFGVGEALVRDAIAAAAGVPVETVRERYAEAGDYGSVARALLPPEGIAPPEVTDVYAALAGVAAAGGKGAVTQKRDLLVDLLRRAGGVAGKHILRIVLGRLRLGIGDPTVMDALSYCRAGDRSERLALERAYNLCSDLGDVARRYLEGGVAALEQVRVEAGRPVRPALCERLNSAAAIIEKIGRCAVEPKIDGFRCQVHRWNGETRVYSRNLEDMSAMFPEIVEAVRERTGPRRLILEGEAAGYDPATLEFVPFQVTVQRKRKHNVAAMRQSLPLKLLAFDLLYLDGEDLTALPYVERRRRLVDLLGDPIDFAAPGAAGTGPGVQPNEAREVADAGALEAYFAGVVERGQEGIVAKRLDAPYQAGARNFNWIKLKRSYHGELRDTVDCVIVGYWRGRGHRARLGIGTLLTAVYDQERDVFTTVTRLGSGFSEEQWGRLKTLLDSVAEPSRPARVESLLTPDVWCTPKYVVEIQADEITQSPMHTTGRRPGSRLGYALRFPRAVGFLREDRSPEDATTVAEIIRLYHVGAPQRATGNPT